MSSSLSDVEDRPVSPNACFHYIPSKIDNHQISHNSNPESSFHVIKNPQQSSPFSFSTRPGNTQTLFTIIPSIPQDSATIINVRRHMVFYIFEFMSKEKSH
jgi:hypothetical protein